MIDPARRKDTIAAIATPPGEGGVSIIRISGPESKRIALAAFRPTAASFTEPQPHHLHHGHLVDTNGAVIDEVLFAYMPGPNSYTAEDTVEINCHGGRAVPASVLRTLLDGGARLAEKGEFTYRAFMNGRLDLTQAEAVAELIHAPTHGAAQLAGMKLEGALGQRVEALRKSLESMRAHMCLAVDFPEDDVECLPHEAITSTSDSVREEIEALLDAVKRTRAMREGALVVLAGMVNAGKSSLLNALLGRNRAIVTDQPGTTRDYIEEYLDLDGVTVRVADTAGLRDTDDIVEIAGLEMSRDLMEKADLVLYVVDNSETIAHENVDACIMMDPRKTIAVMNKLDVINAEPPPWKIFKRHMYEIIKVSAKSGKNIDKLANRIRERILEQAGVPDPDVPVPNERQAQLLRKAAEELQGLSEDAAAGMTHDLLGVRLESACTALESITGRIAPDDVLNSIFDSFCIGK